MNGFMLKNDDPTITWRTNFFMGTGWLWSDLDNADILAKVLDFTGASSVTDLVGDGTACPIAYDREVVERMFYAPKTYEITGTISGVSTSHAALTTTFGPVGKRNELLSHRVQLLVPASDPGYYLQLLSDGYKYTNKFYPAILARKTTFDNSSTTALGLAVGTDVIGTFTLYDQTCNLYGTTGFSEGDITPMEDTLWSVP